jgi:hypothetical protein
MKSKKKLIIVFLLILVVGMASGVIYWTQSTKLPTAAAIEALEPGSGILVTQSNRRIEFSSREAQSIGFIFYPGGGVDYRSYSPQLRLIAEEGIQVFLQEMPLNIAFLGANRAADIIENHPEISIWAIGGHSLGGVAAAEFAANNPEVDALVLWASYPANDKLRFREALQVLSMYGTNDGLTTLQDIEDSKDLLPEDTMFLSIEGGNHAQFGSYGTQNGDGKASMSAEQQASKTACLTADFLLKLLPQ